MMKVLVLSDTHGLLRPQVKRMLGDCDAVVHCGDFDTEEIIDEMKNTVRPGTPLFLVKGNNDRKLTAELPGYLEFFLDGVKFYAVHDRADLPEDLGDCRVAVFGHSHRYAEERKGKRLYLNPGSCGKRRFNLDITAAVLYLENEKVSVEKIRLLEEKSKEKAVKVPQRNMLRAITDIMKRMDRGWQIDRIGKELGLEKRFVEEVCRIRVTHPGVTAAGILNKIEINNL